MKSRFSRVAAMVLISAGALGISAAGVCAATNPATHRISEAYAKSQIRGNYTHVMDMRPTKDGWTAKAMESGKAVTLSVSDMGDVNKA